jgi:hypothetical protein
MLALTLAGAACATGTPSGESEPRPVSGPLPGDNYVLVYHVDTTLAFLDTRTGREHALSLDADQVSASAASPTGMRVAVAYGTGDSSRATVVDLLAGTQTDVHVGPAATTYTMAWSTDGQRLGVGFEPPTGGGGIAVFEADGSVRDMGCRAANRFEAWRSRSQAVVHDAGAFYTVNASNCATLATVQKVGKTQMRYAPNGRRVSFYQDRSVTFTNRSQPQVIPELWMADYAGNGATVVADFQSRPQHSVWSPDAQHITYEVVSRRWANTLHLVTYDVGSGEYRYVAEEKALGVPNDFGACWSPDGSRFAHDRAYARSTGTQSYTTRQVVVREGTEERVVLDIVVDVPASHFAANRPPVCQWMGNHHVLVATHRGYRVVDVDDGETYSVPEGHRVLGARVFDRAP